MCFLTGCIVGKEVYRVQIKLENAKFADACRYINCVPIQNFAEGAVTVALSCRFWPIFQVDRRPCLGRRRLRAGRELWVQARLLSISRRLSLGSR